MKQILFIIFFSLSLLPVGAQNKLKPGKTIIAGEFADGRKDTIRVILFEQMLGDLYVGGRTFQAVINNGKFSFDIPMQADISYVVIASTTQPILNLGQYVINKSDSIFIRINTNVIPLRTAYSINGLTFSGKNSGYFQTRYYADSIFASEMKGIKGFRVDPAKIKADINILWDSIIPRVNMAETKQLNILDRFKDQTNDLMFDILKADYYYGYQRGAINDFAREWQRSFTIADSSERRKKIANHFIDDYLKEGTRLYISPKARSISKSYIDFLGARTAFEMKIERNISGQQNAYSLIPIFEKAPLDVQQKLISLVYASYSRNNPLEGLDSIGRYALRKVDDPYLYKIVNNVYTASFKGNGFYPFALPDATGNIRTLNQLKGKTIFIDFWFTGCVACINLANALKKVKDNFKNDTSVVFVSISTDTDRDTWLNSLQSGKYTDDKSINLYTMGQGTEHALVKKYLIDGFPKILLVDVEGKLYSFNAQRPDAVDGVNKLTRMIFEAKVSVEHRQ